MIHNARVCHVAYIRVYNTSVAKVTVAGDDYRPGTKRDEGGLSYITPESIVITMCSKLLTFKIYYYYWWGGTESLGICSSPWYCGHFGLLYKPQMKSAP
jgi:hypothetical protein